MQLQILWKHLITNNSEYYVFTYLSYVIMLSTQLLFIVPFTIVDNLKFFASYKIQKNRFPSLELQWKAAKLYFCNSVLIWMTFIGSTKLIGWNLFTAMGMRGDLQLPTIGEIIIQLIAFFVIDDLFFYASHRLFHEIPFLYKNVHKIHHKFRTPFVLAALAIHPVEQLFQGIGFFLGPLIMKPHLVTFWIWLVVRQASGFCDHLGYDFQFTKWMYPVLGGSKFHDFHHEKNVGNFASVFPLIDRIFGTEKRVVE